MSRRGNVGSKVKTQTVYKRPKGQKTDLGINTADSNKKGDKQVQAVFAVLLVASVLLPITGAIWAGQRFYLTLKHVPIDWFAAAIMLLTVFAMLFLVRSLAWLSVFASIMLATKLKAWRAQESICQAALSVWKIAPGKATVAAFVLAQNLLGQNKADRSIHLAEEQWQRMGCRTGADQNLALLCSTAALAYQMQGNMRESIVWNERAINAFNAVLQQAKNPKGIFHKLMASQSGRWAGPVHMQLAVIHFHNANGYFNLMNQRTAKENYKKAVDHANQAPDSMEKKEVLKVSREQLSRLKHA